MKNKAKKTGESLKQAIEQFIYVATLVLGGFLISEFGYPNLGSKEVLSLLSAVAVIASGWKLVKQTVK